MRGIHQKILNKQREVESIEKVPTDNQIGFSSESLYIQSLTIMEGDFIMGLGICSSSSNSFSKQYLSSVIEEHLGDDNDLNHSNISMK